MESIIFCQNNLMLSSFCVFEDMRDRDELIDFKLAFANRTFEGHRIVLAAAIPYFREIFSAKKGEIVLDEVDPDTLEAVIDFAYSGKIEISSENVRSLTSAAKFFHLEDVYDSCCKFLAERLHPNSVWDIHTFAEHHDFSELLSATDQYIKQNFEAFAESEGFQSVTFSYLKEIVSKDDLKITTEEKVFEAVLRWVKFSLEERRDHLRNLLLCVRMSQLSFDYLTERALSDKLVQSVKSCKKLVEEAKFCYLIPEKISDCSFTTRARTIDVQKCQERDEFGLYSVCDSESGISIKFLNMGDQKWTTVAQDESKHLHKVAVFGARIYIFLENTIRYFHVKTHTWRALGTFHENLLMSAVVSHNKLIYFFGGPHKSSNIIRCFSPRKNEWLEESQMKRCLDFPGAASLANFIYITGGFLKGTVYKAVERYDPQTQTWDEVSPMLSRRYSHGCTSITGKIYVCGGTNDTDYLNSVEVYDPKTNRWNFVLSMRTPRTAFSIVPHKEKLYTLGGTTGEGSDPAEMEVYDSNKCTWKSGVPLSDTKCEIYLVKAKVPEELNKKASLESLTSISSHMSSGKRQRVIPRCNFCKKLGHISTDCWHKICYNCGKPGHSAGDCTENNKNGAECFQCGKTGHCKHDRPLSKQTDAKCYACGVFGHFSRDCRSSGSRSRRCYSCGGSGHIQGDCNKMKRK